MIALSSTNWRRSETRTVRPFDNAKLLSKALEGSQIRLKSGDSFIDSDKVRISTSEIGKLEVTLKVKLDQDTFNSFSPVERESLRCVVFLECPFLKRTEILFESGLSSSNEMGIEVPVELSKRIRIGYSTSLCVAICLREEQPKLAGKPFRKGHWLAKKDFELSVEKEGLAFSIEPMDDAVRSRFSLPKDSLYYIHYIGGLNEPVEPDSPPARVYVAKEVIDRLTLTSQQRASASIESFLAAEITACIVIRGIHDLGLEEEISAGSPLSSLLRRLKEEFGANEMDVRSWARENDGLMLRAYLHADSQTVRNILAG